MHRGAAIASSSSSKQIMASTKSSSSNGGGGGASQQQRAAQEAKVRALWKRRELAPWAAALEAAPARAARPSAGPRLSSKPELDTFFFEELPRQLKALRASSSSPSLASSSPLAALTAEQLAGVVEWKLARGTWRPWLLDFSRAAKQADVAAAAAAAAEALEKGGAEEEEGGGVGAAIDALCALKGVGPATATALVSAADPSVPFLSDEALTAVLGAREYSRPAALRVTAALRQRAEELNGVQQQQEGKGKEEKGKSCSSSSSWTASKVERALWSASRAEDDEGEGEAKGEEGKKEVEANEEKEKEKKKKKRKLL